MKGNKGNKETRGFQMVLVATQVKRRRGTTAENDAFTGAEGEITVDTEKHELRVHDGVTQGGFVIGSGGSGSGRNIGDMFMTKRTDTALAGAVECNGGTYNTEDYEGAGSIGELLEAGKLDYISLTAYATAISTKGWCDKIGWNGTGTTTFRVPTLTPHIVQKNNIPVIGNGMTLGLTDGKNNFGVGGYPTSSLGFNSSIYGSNVGSSSGSASGAPAKTFGITTDSTKSGMIADLSDVATTERVMIQLFNGATDEAVATCTSVLADVADLKQNKVTKGHEVIEFQAPTAQNNYTWYRLYADGWVEQGGIATNGSGDMTVSLPVEMANIYYTPSSLGKNNPGTAGSFCMIDGNDSSRTTTSCRFIINFQGSQPATKTIFWQVSGMAAQ